VNKLRSLRLHKEDILSKQLCRLTTNQEFLEDALQRAKSSTQSPSDVQFLLSRPDIVSELETEKCYSMVLEPEAQFLPEFTMEEKDRKVRIHLHSHLPYYKAFPLYKAYMLGLGEVLKKMFQLTGPTLKNIKTWGCG